MNEFYGELTLKENLYLKLKMFKTKTYKNENLVAQTFNGDCLLHQNIIFNSLTIALMKETLFY